MKETQVALSNGDGNQTVSPSNVRFARIVRLGRALRGIRVMRLLRWLKTRVVVGGFGRVGWWETNRKGGSRPRLIVDSDLIFRMGWKQTRRGSVYFLVMVTLWKLRMFFFAARWHTQFYDDLKIDGFYTIKDVAAWQIAHLEWALRHSGWLKIHSYLMCLPSRNPDFLGWLL